MMTPNEVMEAMYMRKEVVLFIPPQGKLEMLSNGL